MGDEYNISASQVKSHAKCPKQWWFRYVSDKEETSGDERYLNLGSRVHEAIEDTLTAESPPPLGHEKAVKSAVQNLFAEKSEHEIPDDFYDDGMKYCAKAAEFIAKQEPELRGVEVRHEFEIDRDDISTGVTAIMDIVTENEIWDWKTGTIRDETPHEEKIQGAVYMAAYHNKYGETPDSIRFVYVKEGKVRNIDPSDEIWEYMIDRAQDLINAKQTGEFAPEPGDQCYWCSYELWCDASPVGVGGVPYEEY
jgi:CRISPR/Cas system-associated exonuclease Cas4 (RecB family)